jgi:hypothetical protein
MAVPGPTPETTPEDVPTVATATLPLVHAPPDVALLKEVVRPVHVVSVPDIAVGGGVTFTVTVEGTPQPHAVVVRLYTYVPVAVGVIVVEAQVAQEMPTGPVQA